MNKQKQVIELLIYLAALIIGIVLLINGYHKDRSVIPETPQYTFETGGANIMLLLFMTSNKNRGLLDKPCQDNNIGIEHITGEFELRKFVAQDMSNLNCFSHITIDLSCLTDTDDEIIKHSGWLKEHV